MFDDEKRASAVGGVFIMSSTSVVLAKASIPSIVPKGARRIDYE
jgi:hypothetical protein